MASLSFTIPGNPVAKARPRVVRHGGRVMTYTPAQTRIYEDAVRVYARLAWRGKPPLRDTAICMSILCTLEIPPSWSKKEKAAAAYGKPHLGKPDWDNLGKIVSDALNGIIYADDSAVYEVTVTKLYGPLPGTVVTLNWRCE